MPPDNSPIPAQQPPLRLICMYGKQKIEKRVYDTLGEVHISWELSCILFWNHLMTSTMIKLPIPVDYQIRPQIGPQIRPQEFCLKIFVLNVSFWHGF
jgi:hypothetical protein